MVIQKKFLLVVLACTTAHVVNGYCNWSNCNGVVQGGSWCNENENRCETGCGGTWCDSGGGSSGGCEIGWTKATLTSYTSYPLCCPDEANYDPNANTDECVLFNGCTWAGYFAYKSGKQPVSWVQSTDIVALFSTFGAHDQYANRQIRVNVRGQTFQAEVVDTCADSDCNGCCTQNAESTGSSWLVDLEYYTAVRNLGGQDNAYGEISFKLFKLPILGTTYGTQ